MTYWETIGSHLSDAWRAIAAIKEASERQPTIRLAFRFLQGFLFLVFAWGTLTRLMMAVVAEGFSWQLWLDLAIWVCAGALFFGFWRPWRRRSARC